MKLAGVKLWVLTGDKVETAINIGFACSLLDDDMELFIIDKVSTKEIYRQMEGFFEIQEMTNGRRDHAVIIGGE